MDDSDPPPASGSEPAAVQLAAARSRFNMQAFTKYTYTERDVLGVFCSEPATRRLARVASPKLRRRGQQRRHARREATQIKENVNQTASSLEERGLSTRLTGREVATLTETSHKNHSHMMEDIQVCTVNNKVYSTLTVIASQGSQTKVRSSSFESSMR
ncbi:Protein of unknown function [Gryllus bimaculatus]|nr:Protein of unknown function [Gryllus bimaculatus]